MKVPIKATNVKTVVILSVTLVVMATRQRSDIYINLPTFQKLDAMLLKEKKWWLPVPCVPPDGLSEKSRKHLGHKRDCANQIHETAMAINNSILTEMEILYSYMAALPKSGRASLGDLIYHYMSTTEKFFQYHLLDCLSITSEQEALELADRVEASMYTWRRKTCMSHSKFPWIMVKDLMSNTDRNDKNHMLAERVESLLFYLKQRYPELSPNLKVASTTLNIGQETTPKP